MRELLKQLRGTEYQGVKELADAAERFLREAGPTQGKGTVAEFPNERTVRYYISSGLLTSATEKRGLRSVFGYEHLLKLLTIKKLQADGLPISVIKELISDKTNDDLEKLFGEEIRIFADRQSLESYQQASGSDEEVIEVPLNDFDVSSPPASASKSKAREYLESLLLKPKAPAEVGDRDVLFSRVSEAPQASRRSKQPAPPAPGTWKRYELVPGLELHAREDFKPPRDRGVIMRMMERILGQFDSK